MVLTTITRNATAYPDFLPIALTWATEARHRARVAAREAGRFLLALAVITSALALPGVLGALMGGVA